MYMTSRLNSFCVNLIKEFSQRFVEGLGVCHTLHICQQHTPRCVYFAEEVLVAVPQEAILVPNPSIKSVITKLADLLCCIVDAAGAVCAARVSFALSQDIGLAFTFAYGGGDEGIGVDILGHLS
ncbi:hypothetical protein Ancab_022209 [Ancistrocladus abbreviatus]